MECKDAKTKEYINGSYASYKLAFAVYPDITSCIGDYLSIMSRPRYRPVREAKNYVEATDQIRLCGYATSPNYTKNLRTIIEKYKLYELDYKMNPNDNLTANFKCKEFYCKGTIPYPDSMANYIYMLATELQKVRDFLGKPIIVTSGYRTKEYNDYIAKLGYTVSKNSYHLKGMAVDSRCNSISLTDYALLLMRLTDFNSVGIGNGFVHTDLRNSKFTIIHY